MSASPTVADQPRRSGWRKWKGWIGFALGVGLLFAAAIVIASTPGMFEQLIENLTHAPLWAILVILLGPLVSWVLVGVCLQLLLLRHGRVGFLEMLMLVGSAWLLNHLPMRPGLVGRVGYHKLVNGIRVRDAVESTIWALAFSVISNVLVVALVLSVPETISSVGLIGVLFVPPMFAGLLAIVMIRSSNMSKLFAGFALRYVDVLIWLARYGAVFAALGLDASATQIAMVAAVSQFAQLIPITGGGIGFREWGVGITARQGGHAMEAAIGADLINRAVETLWVIPIGFYSTWWVARRLRRYGLDHRDDGSIRTSDEMPSP